MFCPKCATQNIDGASFCRVCGANISLVPQALSGQPAVVEDHSRAGRRMRKRGERKASIEHALKNILFAHCVCFGLERSRLVVVLDVDSCILLPRPGRS